MRSIQVKLALSHTLPVLILLPVLTLYLLYTLEGFFIQNLLRQVNYEALVLQDRIQSDPTLAENGAAAQQFLSHTESLTGARIFIVSQNSTILASSRPDDARFTGMILADKDVTNALKGLQSAGVGPGFGTDVAYVVLPLNYGGLTKAALRFSYDLSDVRAEFAQLERLVVAGVGLTLIVGLLLGLGLANTITQPLHRLSDAARRVARGNYRERVPSSSQDEVGMLTNNFNRMVERLEEAEYSRRRQLAAIMHELARPLTGMRAAADTLRDGADSDLAERTVLLDGMAEEMERLQRLVETLQQMQARTLRPIELNRTEVSLERIVRASVANFQARATQSQITLALEMPPTLPIICADVDRLIQVMTNLLDNAFKYTRAGGRITVQAGETREGAFVSVFDSGPGISAEEIPYVFQEFYRGGTEHVSEKRGMGLGLAICRDIISAHGGTIQASSPLEGGTCITFSIPHNLPTA